MEILRQHQGPLDAIFVPVGGGGLIAGIAAYVKYLRPEIRIIGVESEHSACLQAALQADQRVVLPRVGTFADGVAVAQIGAHGFEVCRFCVDEVLTVSNDELCAAIKNIYDDTRSITEPSGALAVAGIKKYVAKAQPAARPSWPSIRGQHQFRQFAACGRARRIMRRPGVKRVSRQADAVRPLHGYSSTALSTLLEADQIR
jgi:threonine dehydratase